MYYNDSYYAYTDDVYKDLRFRSYEDESVKNSTTSDERIIFPPIYSYESSDIDSVFRFILLSREKELDFVELRSCAFWSSIEVSFCFVDEHYDT